MARSQAFRAAPLAVLIGAIAAGCLGEPARAPAEQPPAAPPAATPELRTALRAFYVKALTDELALPPDRANTLAPKVEALLDAQRSAVRDMVAAGLVVRRATEGDGDPAAAVDAFLREEHEGRDRTSAARQAILADLTIRQRARFLAFEGRFRERVRAVVAGERAGSATTTGGPDDGTHDESTAPADRAAAPHPRGPRSARPGGEPSESGERAGDGAADGARDEMRHTLVLFFVDEVRRELTLDDAHALALIGPVQAVVDARVQGEAERRRLVGELGRRATDDTATDTELDGLVRQALGAEKSAADTTLAARKAVLSTFSPPDAAKYLVIEQRFLARLRQQGRSWKRGGDSSGQRTAAPGELLRRRMEQRR